MLGYKHNRIERKNEMINFDGHDFNEQEFLDLYMKQKTAENDAKELRVKMEEALLARYGDDIEEDKASKTFKEGRYTLSIKRTIRYDLTDKGWQYVMSLPEEDRPVDIKYNHTKGKQFPKVYMEEVPHETKPTFTVTYK